MSSSELIIKMTEIKKQLKQLSRTQVGVSLTKEDREIIKAKVGDIVKISLDVNDAIDGMEGKK